MAGPAGLRDRRHDHDRADSTGEPGRLPPSRTAAPPAAPATRSCGCWPWSAAAPAPSSTPCSAPTSAGETTYAAGLIRSLRAGMLLLADRNFGSGPLARQIAAAEADFLVRVRTGNGAPKLPVLRRLPDGSWLSRFGGVPVRVIDASWTVTTSAGRFTSDYRLVTTLTDPARFTASDLAVLYHERWEIETAYLELKSTILGGRVLRARTPAGIDQEIYALLVTYQALRTAIADAAAHRPGHRPRPGQLHHRPERRPRPGHPGRGRHRRRQHRPRRPDRPPRPRQPHARPAAADQPPRRQARHLQVQRPGQSSTAPPTRPPSTSPSSPPICQRTMGLN